MMQYVIKVIITAVAVVAISELGKRSSIWGAVLASLPLTSLLAFVWLYFETGNTEKIAALSSGIFWLVIPSLALFVVLTFMLRQGVSFWLSFGVSCAVTVVAVPGRMHVVKLSAGTKHSSQLRLAAGSRLGVLSVRQFKSDRPLSKVVVDSSVLLTYNESLQLTAQLAGASWVPSAAYGRSGGS